MSILGSEEVIINTDSGIYKGPISKFIDPFFKKNDKMLSEVADVSGNYIIGVCQKKEKTSWNEISQVSRHPANGKLVRVKTMSGRITTATLSHSFLKRTKNGMSPILGKDLKIGSKIPITRFIPIVKNPIKEFEGYKLTEDFGYLIGAYLLNGFVYNDFEIVINNKSFDKIINIMKSIGVIGTYEKRTMPSMWGWWETRDNIKCINEKLANFLKNNFGLMEKNRKIAPFVFQSNFNFIFGIINGYFSKENNKEYGSVSLESKNLVLDMSILLNYCGIFSECKKNESFKTETINILDLENDKEIDVVWDEIVELEILDDPKEYVYDFTIPGNQTFMLSSGILVHNTLNTFHHSGISSKNVTLGVPRLEELINVSKKLKAPSLTIYPMDYQDIDELRSKVEYKTLKDVTINTKIYNINEKTIEEDTKFVNEYEEIEKLLNKLKSEKFDENSEWILRIELNSKELEYTKIDMFDIMDKIHQKGLDENLNIQMNDDNAEHLVIRIQIPKMDKEDYEIMEILRKVEIDFLNKIQLKGLSNVSKVFVNKETKEEVWESKEGWVRKDRSLLETEGTNLRDALNLLGIDHTRTVSNDILEIYEVLGIEAARHALLNEVRNVISFDGSYVNYRHLSLLVDTMTYKGFIMAINRHGINRASEINTLMKCSFEETVDVLTESAVYSHLDIVKGVSENIMLGQLAPVGTGTFKLLLDGDSLKKNIGKPDLGTIEEEEEKVELDEKIHYIPNEPDYIKKMVWYIPSEPDYRKIC